MGIGVDSFGMLCRTVISKWGSNKFLNSEDNCKGRIGGVEGLASPGGDLYQPARSATCWRG